jgi:hypothetical protein
MPPRSNAALRLGRERDDGVAQNKTKPTKVDVGQFIDSVADPKLRADAREVRAMMERLSGHKPVMWGPTIIGFGSYRYKYESGHGGEMARIGFSPRTKELVFYLIGGLTLHPDLLARLGKHRTGKCCLYVKSLDLVDRGVLEELIAREIAYMREKYPE